MASAVSDDSDTAPLNFPLSSSEDDLLEKTFKDDKCPLCRSAKKHFLCADCVRNGDFYSTRCMQRESSQRFVEKKMALLKVKGEIQELLSHSQAILARKNKCLAIKQEIITVRERIHLLQQWKGELHKSIATNKTNLCKLKTKNQDSHNLLNLSKETPKDIENLKPKSTAKQQLESNRAMLKEIIQENVKLLLTVIFPITCEGIAGEEDSESLATVKNALADASQTAYVRGQWVYADTGHHGRYRICGAILPGTGDMSAYTLCVEQSKKDGDTEMLGHFKVALSHVTQLSHHLAFYFGLRLPKKLNHLDFIRSDLDAKRFSRKIARLHANVLFLCASQGVAPIHLRHANPLARLSTLLDPNICDLGRTGPFEFHPEIWPFEEAGEDDGCAASASSSDGEDDDGDLNADWESVGHLPQVDAVDESNQPSSPTPSSGRSGENPVTNSVVSVVSGVASLWKAFPWSK